MVEIHKQVRMRASLRPQNGARESPTMVLKSRDSLARVEIGSNVVTADFSLKGRFKRDHPLGRDLFSVEPHRDMRLSDTALGDRGQAGSQGSLPSAVFNSFPQFLDTHGLHHNTRSVMDVNTRSVLAAGQTGRMPKAGKTTDFWRRLTLARTTCSPPKSMRQDDIAKDYGAAFQSTVTKWKTGGEDGATKPRPEIVERMAEDTGVSFDWLYTGRGEMRLRTAPDDITIQIIEAVSGLEVAGRIEVLKAAITQQTMRLPAVAARMQEVERLAEIATRTKSKKKA